jgi:hypothetical protein
MDVAGAPGEMLGDRGRRRDVERRLAMHKPALVKQSKPRRDATGR